MLDSFKNGFSDLMKGRFNVFGRFSRGFYKVEFELLSQILAFLKAYHSFVGNITFVSNEQSVHIFLGVLINFLHPGLDTIKGVSVGYVVNDNYAMSSSVVAASDGSESILTCCVPLKIRILYNYNLQFHILVLQVN
jgi:hypothetical protein